jgi:hypothetical protein
MTTRPGWLCECDSENCLREIEMTHDEMLRISREGLIAVSDGCLNGPSPGDELVEKKDGYSLYRPAT